jgi:hypothetical protein
MTVREHYEHLRAAEARRAAMGPVGGAAFADAVAEITNHTNAIESALIVVKGRTLPLWVGPDTLLRRHARGRYELMPFGTSAVPS